MRKGIITMRGRTINNRQGYLLLVVVCLLQATTHHMIGMAILWDHLMMPIITIWKMQNNAVAL